MATVLTVIQNSMRLIGVLAQGETPSNSEAADALSRLNLMLANWLVERINIYAIHRDTKVLTPAVQTYTVGIGGALNIPRPVKIDNAGIIQPTSLIRTPLVIIEQPEWALIPEKAVTGVLPLKLYDDYAYPLSTLSLWPVPSNASTLEIYHWQELDGFTAVTDAFDLPPGYQMAIEYNLALLLAPEYGRPVDQVLAAIAGSSRSSLAQRNVAGGLPQAPQPAPPQQQAA